MGDRRGTVFFDYDGTLHDTMALYGPAFRAACAWLSKEGWLERRTYADADIACWLGWTTEEMWTSPCGARPRCGCETRWSVCERKAGPGCSPVSRRPSMR